MAAFPTGTTKSPGVTSFAILAASLITLLVRLVDAAYSCDVTVAAGGGNATTSLTLPILDAAYVNSSLSAGAGGFIAQPGFLLPLALAFASGAVLTATLSSFLGGRDPSRRHGGETREDRDDEGRTRGRHGEDEDEVEGDGDGDDDGGRPIRVFLDGAFDMMHYGHFNALRLAKGLDFGGDGRRVHLIAGIDSGEGIAACKGPPLMTDAERLEMVRSCRFVDEVVEDVPYSMTPEYIDEIVEKYDIDYLIHGDDPCVLPDGSDAYGPAKRMGKFRSVPRTEGVSTTDLIGRMLAMAREEGGEGGEEEKGGVDGGLGGVDESSTSALGRRSTFLTTGRILREFSAGLGPPAGDARVIYLDGAWDVFHLGHAALLKAARQRGDYVIVGIHGDDVVRERRGGRSGHLPLMNLHERVLGVLGCRYVDDVIVDAPRVVTGEMIASLNISEVVRGSRGDEFGRGDDRRRWDDERERYAVPRDAGKYKVIESPSDFSLERTVRRIQMEKQAFQAKFERKKSQEIEYYQGKYGGGSAMRD